MKKQVRRITKKILILSLATSLIFTSCFSHKKLEVKAASIAATLSAFSLYEICLYIGGLAVTALGIGYAYESRDEIAEFGKTVIDSMTTTMTSTPEGWMFGSYTESGSTIYGAEAFLEVSGKAWDYIKEGGLTPASASDLTGDGYIDISDRDFELSQTKYWTIADGMECITSHIQTIYDSWLNGDPDNVIKNTVGPPLGYAGWYIKDGAYWIGDMYVNGHHIYIESEGYFAGGLVNYERNGEACAEFLLYKTNNNNHDWAMYIDGVLVSDFDNNLSFNLSLNYEQYLGLAEFDAAINSFTANFPVFPDLENAEAYPNSGSSSYHKYLLNYIPGAYSIPYVSDLIDIGLDHTEYLGNTLEEIAVALRPLQDVADIADSLASVALDLTVTADIYRDLALDLADTYVPAIDAVVDPVYWPDTNTAPPLDIADLPNAEVANPDIPMPDGPSDEDPDNPDIDLSIDLDGLLSLFNILLYIIMIIIMLIYLFLACLAFIVMIFRIPASSSMLPEEMVMGFEHLKTIMIPGMNISIYGFAMALIYMFIIFAVIKALRLEINDFKIPRSFKK